MGGECGGESGGTGACGGGGGEGGAEAVEGALEAFLGGFFGDVQGGADFSGGFVLVVLEEEGFAVGGVEAREGGVEVGGDFLPERIGLGGLFRAHGGGLLFVTAAGGFLFECVGSAVAGGAEEPAVELAVGGEESGFLRDEDEDGLGDVLGGLGVADEAVGEGIDPVDVAADELGEGVLVFVGGEGREQLGVGHWKSSVFNQRCRLGGKGDRG